MKLEDLMNYSLEYKIPFFMELSDFPLIKESQQIIPLQLAKQNEMIPLKIEEEGIICAFTHLEFDQACQELKIILGKKIQPVLSTKEAIFHAIDRCYQEVHTFQSLNSGPLKDESEVDYDLDQDESKAEVVSFLNQIFIQGIRKKASDIHFDPNDEGLAIRMRIDGSLIVYYQVPKEFSKQLTTRIKVLSKLDISETRLPQDGRIKIKFSAKEIDFRISTLPTAYGERVVLRILDNSNIVLGLKESGMNPFLLDSFRSMMKRSQGLILVTGPTGSGKTSTLYSAISELDANSLNIMTIEDPVEFKLKGLAQIGVNHKIDFTFAKGLRHILRQDPDVIMIGEIRDKETAEIAIQSALTGHLVVSTLHTNDAPSALTRLIDMGIEPFLISSCVTGILAQRLVRRLCKNCLKLDEDPLKKALFGIDPSIPIYAAKGCDECFHLGYKGRIGLFEWMPMEDCLKEQLMRSHDSHQLAKVAQCQGMKTLKEAAKDIVINQITSIDEVIKVIP